MHSSLIHNQVVTALSTALEHVRDSENLTIPSMPEPTVELPKQEKWGDLSSNVAMAVAPKFRRAPLKVAELLATTLKADCDNLFERVDIVPPGFLNFTIKPSRWIEVLSLIEDLGESFGSGQVGKGKRVVVEFVSACWFGSVVRFDLGVPSLAGCERLAELFG